MVERDPIPIIEFRLVRDAGNKRRGKRRIQRTKRGSVERRREMARISDRLSGSGRNKGGKCNENGKKHSAPN